MKPASIAIIFDESRKKVLLVKRMDVPVWVLPGGGIDAGETPELAVIREVAEETGFEIEIERLSGEYYPINRLSAYTYVYICQIKGGELTGSSETRFVEFFELEQLPKEFFEVHRDWLNDALVGSGVVRKPISKVTYLAVLRHFLRNPIQVLRYLWTRLTKSS